MKPSKYRILFVSQDAGGFQAIIPVYRRLKQRKTFVVSGIFGDIVRVLPSARGLKLTKPSTLTDADLHKAFDRLRPQLVVTGPSAAATSLDKRAMALAKKHSIPTLMIADNCMNTDMLFAKGEDEKERIFPDRICVMNDTCSLEMKNGSVPSELLRVTGSPYFDTVTSALAKSKTKKRILLFICQPFSEFVSEFPDGGFGYLEQDVFADVAAAANRIGGFDEILVRWHPRTRNHHKFDVTKDGSVIPMRFDSKSSLHQLIRDASLVVGMNSTALMDAALAGKPVVSYQPGLNRRDALMTNAWGLSTLVTKKQQLFLAMRRALRKKSSKKSDRVREKFLPSGATNRVIRVIQEMLNV